MTSLSTLNQFCEVSIWLTIRCPVKTEFFGTSGAIQCVFSAYAYAHICILKYLWRVVFKMFIYISSLQKCELLIVLIENMFRMAQNAKTSFMVTTRYSTFPRIKTNLRGWNGSCFWIWRFACLSIQTPLCTDFINNKITRAI